MLLARRSVMKTDGKMEEYLSKGKEFFLALLEHHSVS